MFQAATTTVTEVAPQRGCMNYRRNGAGGGVQVGSIGLADSWVDSRSFEGERLKNDGLLLCRCDKLELLQLQVLQGKSRRFSVSLEEGEFVGEVLMLLVLGRRMCLRSVGWNAMRHLFLDNKLCIRAGAGCWLWLR